MEEDLCRGLYTSLLCSIIPLVSLLLPFWYPYILLHFFITCIYAVMNDEWILDIPITVG